MSDNVYLQALKSNGALISYCNHFPGYSAKYEYVEATRAELAWLNDFEDNVLPAGMVATISDLMHYRAKAKNVFQLQAKLTESKVQYGKAQLAHRELKSELDTLLDKAAKERGITKAELITALKARKSDIESRSAPCHTELPTADERFRQSIADMFKHPRKYQQSRT